MTRLPFHLVVLCLVAFVAFDSISGQLTNGVGGGMNGGLGGGGMNGGGIGGGGIGGGGMNGGGLNGGGMNGAGMNGAVMNGGRTRGMNGARRVARPGAMSSRRGYYPYQNMGIMMLLGDAGGDFCPQGYFLDMPRPCPCGMFEYCIFGYCCAMIG